MHKKIFIPFLFFYLLSIFISTPSEAKALRVTESNSIFKISADDGALQKEIKNIEKASALAADVQRKNLWTYSHKRLASFTSDGELIKSLTIHDSEDEADLAINPDNGPVWLVAKKKEDDKKEKTKDNKKSKKGDDNKKDDDDKDKDKGEKEESEDPELDEAMVIVPNVIGLAQSTAESTIISANLAVGTITTANSNAVPQGNVISQNPSGGASVSEKSTVDMVVSLDPLMITVPNVLGLAQSTAESTIISANLAVGTITQINSATAPTGDVISQNPVAGTSIAKGAPVNLEISLGPVMIAVPNVVGNVQATAESTIISANLTVGTITQINSATVPAGDVISQNPVAGTSIAKGSPVNIEISLGPLMITVPNVVGNVQATAESNITAAGLTVGAITTANSVTIPTGDVISQNPAAGTSIANGSPVNLEISLGPVMITVPNVVGNVQATAESNITATGLTVGTITQINSATVATGNVISQHPAAGASIAKGAPVNLGISLGPLMITVPNLVGAVQATAESNITAAGLTVGAITTANSATAPTGDVISQNPVSGTSIAKGSSINLEISLGPVMIAVPNLVGAVQATAESTIISANLTLERSIKLIAPQRQQAML